MYKFASLYHSSNTVVLMPRSSALMMPIIRSQHPPARPEPMRGMMILTGSRASVDMRVTSFRSVRRHVRSAVYDSTHVDSPRRRNRGCADMLATKICFDGSTSTSPTWPSLWHCLSERYAWRAAGNAFPSGTTKPAPQRRTVFVTCAITVGPRLLPKIDSKSNKSPSTC